MSTSSYVCLAQIPSTDFDLGRRGLLAGARERGGVRERAGARERGGVKGAPAGLGGRAGFTSGEKEVKVFTNSTE